MRRLFIALLALLAEPTTSTAADPGPFEALAARVQPSIVTVRGLDRAHVLLRERPGFFLGDAHVVTVRHPLVGASEAEVVLSSGEALPVTAVEAEERALDLVLLRVGVPDRVETDLSPTRARGLRWARTPAKTGDLVVVVPDGPPGRFPVSAGTLRTRQAMPGVGEILTIDAEVPARREGSPVVTYGGEVVGVAAIGHDPAGAFAFVAGHLAALRAGDANSVSGWSDGAQACLTRPASSNYATARVLLSGGDTARALIRLEQTLMKAPGHQDAWLALGVALGQLGRWEEAIEAFERTTRLNPENVEAQVNLCVALAQVSRWGDALPRCQRALRLTPERPDLHFHLGLTLQHLDREEEARAAYEAALERRPGYPDAAYNLGLLHARRGRHDQAVAAFSSAARVDAGFRDTLRRLGDAEQARGRHREAVDAYRKALELSGPEALTLTHLGRSLVALEQLGKALAAFEEAARVKPDEARTFLALGDVLQRLRRTELALHAFRHAARLAPQAVAAHLALADLCRQEGAWGEARDAYGAALALDARSVDAHYGLGLVHLAQGERDAAWEQVRALEPLDLARSRALGERVVRETPAER